jgi:tetratricopeptide (TPR) repeat protein
MSFWIRLIAGVCLVCLVLELTGCSPGGQGQSDEENEPHFVLGKDRVNAMDYQGAIEAFEESLEVNPHSAAANFELGWLYDEKVPNPAAAIYHYQQYLKYDPSADNADVIKQRIYRCKQQLAADVLPLPSTPAAQEQLDKLAEQNRQLQQQVNTLQAALKKWTDWYASQQAAKNNSPVAQDNSEPQPTPQSVENPPPPPKQSEPIARPSRVAEDHHYNESVSRPRAYAVVRGDTAMAITRKFGLRLSTLQAANPGVDLSRIRVGQILNLPP